jgi:hypothetical protein
MADEMLSYSCPYVHHAPMINPNAVRALSIGAAPRARARRGVNFVNFVHLDTAR